MHRSLALLIALAALAAGGSASAQGGDHWSRCAASETETAIAGCTAVVDSGAFLGAELAAAYYNRGIAYWRKGQHERANNVAIGDAYDRAIADYGRAIALNPGDARALVNRGIVHYEEGRFAAAIADDDAAPRLRPDLPEAVNNRALAYLKLGQYDLAQRDFDHVIRLVKNYGNALINRPLAPAKGPSG